MSAGESPAPAKSFTGGVVSGGLTALVMLGLLVFIVVDDQLSSIYLSMLIAVALLGPLLLVNLLLSAVYARRRAPGAAFLWIWGPPLAVLTGLWLFASFRQMRDDSFDLAHPNIREVHVNLSGRSLWLDPESTVNDSAGAGELPAGQPEKFVALTRYARDYYGHDRLLPYTGSRLAADFTSLAVYYGQPAETAATRLPLVVAAPYPDVARFMSSQQIAHQGEASVLVHLYYHYADRVEVAPALRLSGSQAMDQWGRQIPLVAFHLANLHALPLARLEIDGQAVDLGDAAFASEDAADGGCTSRNYAAHAINELDAPLRVRWQFAEPQARWHAAVVRVPEYASARRPVGRARSTSVELYFQDDGSVVAERSLEIDQAEQKFALWTTGPGQALRRRPPCGTAAERYDERVEIVTDRRESAALGSLRGKD